MQGAAAATTLQGLAEYLAIQTIEAARRSRNIHLPRPAAGSFARDPFLALQQWLSQAEWAVPGKRFLWCLDEFEHLSEVVEVTGSRAPLNFLRHVLQNRSRWLLLFSGSHKLDDLEPYWSDYLIDTRALHLTYLEEPEARGLIQQPVEAFPEIYEPEAVDAIAQLTRCQPYLVQQVCYVLVEELNRQERRRVAVEDVRFAIPKAIQQGGMYFREQYRSSTESEQAQLLYLVRASIPSTQRNVALQGLVRKESLRAN